ncbi:carbohydrate-binding domain-containing protein [Candidatus Sumerlaeota bacterium]|nr:carbohydrate-binding domain-containing protein [Candidatus Sumerlaeota bacterium]
MAGTGVTVDGTSATITAGGDYLISGTLNAGQIRVESADDNIVKLILNGVNITSALNAPISVEQADKTVIILPPGSLNTVTDPASYTYVNSGDDEPNAAIFSKDDLSICGSGSLTINANYNDGLSCKDGLVINGGTLVVNAIDDGIRGKDYLVVKAGTITVNTAGDALKSDNDTDATMGYILIEDGTLNLTSTGADGFDAYTDALIKAGTITVTTGGGSGVTPSDLISTKGIKGTQCVIVDNGTFTINSSDDAIHSNTDVLLDNGTYTLYTGDDAIHGDATLTINSGTINILTCVEGIESNEITLNGGDYHVTASDDAMNSSAGTDVEGDDGSCSYVYGGHIVLTATVGDGWDGNGDLVMTDGTVIIHGPSSDPEVIVDYNGTFNISGGLFIGSGSSSNMTQAPSSSSSQNSLKVMFTSSYAATTLFHLQTSAGAEVITFRPTHQYRSIVFSSSALQTGTTYQIYMGGSHSGVNTDGVYSGGTYTPGTLYTTFTVTQRVTSLGSSGPPSFP